MSIFNSGNFSKPFNVSQPELNSSDRTAYLKCKTKYAAAVNLAKNGGVLVKRDGSRFVGPVQTTSASVVSAASYADLLDLTKGKYVLTPPPSSKLSTAFSPSNGDVYYGNFTVTNYQADGIPVTALGYPTINTAPDPDQYVYPNQLVRAATSTLALTAPLVFNSTNIVVDPNLHLFYIKGTCSTRNYFQNVLVDPSIEVTWSTETAVGGEVFSSRPYNEQQAQRILANQAYKLRGFQFPTPVHLDLDNCESRPSITPVAPDAPVISIVNQVATGAGVYTITISWLYAFDGGSPISTSPSPSTNPIWGYTIYTSTGFIQSTAPSSCLNTYTLTNVPLGTDIWITASNCVPKNRWNRGVFLVVTCTTLTSVPSNRVTVAPLPVSLSQINAIQLPDNGSVWTLAANSTVPYGSILTIPSGHTLQLPTSGYTLTNNGTIVIYGTIVNVGTIINNGTIENNSNTIDNRGALTNNAAIVNRGQITNASSGTITNASSGTITNASSGTITNNGTIANSGVVFSNVLIAGVTVVPVPVPVPVPAFTPTPAPTPAPTPFSWSVSRQNFIINGTLFLNIGTDIPSPTNATSSIVYSVSTNISSFVGINGQVILCFVFSNGTTQTINGTLSASQFGETVSIPVAINLAMFGNSSITFGQ